MLLSPNLEILVYADIGAEPETVFKNLQDSFIKFPYVSIKPVTAQELIEKAPLDPLSVMAIVFPGGQKPGYDETLGKEGISAVQNYIANGGVFYGFCKGAYYAAEHLQWMPENSFGVEKFSGLGLFQGSARGPLQLFYDQFQTQDAQITPVSFHSVDGRMKQTKCLYWGGPAFFHAQDSSFEVLARFEELPERPAAIIKTLYGDGIAILSSIHAEVPLQKLKGFLTSIYNDDDAAKISKLADTQDTHYGIQDLWLTLLHQMTQHRQKRREMQTENNETLETITI